KPPSLWGWGFFLQHKSLTMTYFHRRTSTIIGAKAFHGPVRDGKEWDHLAMVVKRNRLFNCAGAAKRIWEEAPRLSFAARGVMYGVCSWRTGRDGYRAHQLRGAWPCAHWSTHSATLFCLNGT